MNNYPEDDPRNIEHVEDMRTALTLMITLLVDNDLRTMAELVHQLDDVDHLRRVLQAVLIVSDNLLDPNGPREDALSKILADFQPDPDEAL